MDADLHGLKKDTSDHDVDVGVTQAPHAEVTKAVIGAAFDVYYGLGYGFLERVYQRALQVELLKRGLTAELEAPMPVHYKGVVVGEYFTDVLVAGNVVVELKVAPAYQKADEAQLLNALKAFGNRVGLLINFGRHKVEFHRFIM